VHERIFRESWRTYRFDVPTRYVAVEEVPGPLATPKSYTVTGGWVSWCWVPEAHLSFPNVTDRHRRGSPDIW
jgi:hypothetical protein